MYSQLEKPRLDYLEEKRETRCGIRENGTDGMAIQCADTSLPS